MTFGLRIIAKSTMASCATDSTVAAGNAAFVDEDYDTAIMHYSTAVDSFSNQPEALSYILSRRAAAYLKLEQYNNAIEDATLAISHNPEDATAYQRLGLSLYYIGHMDEAQQRFNEALNPSRKGLTKALEKEARKYLALCSEGSEATEKKETATAETELNKGNSNEQLTNMKSAEKEKSTQTTNAISKTNESSIQQPPVATRRTYDWYQSQTHVTVTFLAKNTIKEESTVSILDDERTLSVQLKLMSGSEYVQELELFAPVNASTIRVNYKSVNVEVKLEKAQIASWPQLVRLANDAPVAVAAATSVASSAAPPSYPTSSRKQKDWSQLEKELEDETDEQPESEGGLQQLFRTIYKDADENTRRAMIKSFQTSGGTVLSTNWNEVSKTNYEENVQAPQGMEPKKWEY